MPTLVQIQLGPTYLTIKIGKVAEWLIAPVLKTDLGYTNGGSNPSLSVHLLDLTLKLFNYIIFIVQDSVIFLIELCQDYKIAALK